MNARLGTSWWRLVPLLLVAAGGAEARHHHHHHGSWHQNWENRQDARRAGVVAGVVAAGVAGAAARSEAEHRYSECLLATGYDFECERRRFYDEQRARTSARRAGVLTGIAAHAIVRD